MKRKRGPVGELKACYPVVELAELLGWNRWRTLRWLARKGITVDKSTGTASVWLSELQRAAPEAWESVVTVRSLRRVAR